jgi:hypothetical protein
VSAEGRYELRSVIRIMRRQADRSIISADADSIVLRRPYADAPVLYGLVASQVLASGPEAAAWRFSWKR